MPDKFDPYREALIMETTTEWPEGTELDPRERMRLELLLHEHPEEASHLEYVRSHTGFCRHIVVTEDDLARISS